MMVNIARCPEHGLHGERSECFECGGPVEQVPMVPCDDAALGRAVTALLEDSGLPTYGGFRATIERRVRLAFCAAGDIGGRA